MFLSGGAVVSLRCQSPFSLLHLSLSYSHVPLCGGCGVIAVPVGCELQEFCAVLLCDSDGEVSMWEHMYDEVQIGGNELCMRTFISHYHSHQVFFVLATFLSLTPFSLLLTCTSCESKREKGSQDKTITFLSLTHMYFVLP